MAIALSKETALVDKPVYSTATGSQKQAVKSARSGAYKPAAGPCKMRLETKGRGGKVVTVLFNLTLPTEAAARELMQEIQAACGCGATFKDQTIELRGDLRDRVEAYALTKGLRFVRAGG
jgi:translation initiation factor 1